jgi:hypothetical protein
MVSIKRAGFLYHLESSVVDPDPHHFCLWIRIRIRRNKNTGSASNKNHVPDPVPDESDKLDQDLELDPHQSADYKQKCIEYEPIEHFSKGLSLPLEARIWIRIRMRLNSRIRVCIYIK